MKKLFLHFGSGVGQHPLKGCQGNQEEFVALNLFRNKEVAKRHSSECNFLLWKVSAASAAVRASSIEELPWQSLPTSWRRAALENCVSEFGKAAKEPAKVANEESEKEEAADNEEVQP